VGAGTTCDDVVIELVVTDVTDLFAAEMTVTFNSAVAVYDGNSVIGSVLSSDGAQIEVLEHEQPGQVTLGLTRLAADGVDVTGSAVLVKIMFQKPALDDGSTPLGIPSGSLLGSETPPQVKGGIQWVGGTLTID
jgi:hypothetical protein